MQKLFWGVNIDGFEDKDTTDKLHGHLAIFDSQEAAEKWAKEQYGDAERFHVCRVVVEKVRDDFKDKYEKLLRTLRELLHEEA